MNKALRLDGLFQTDLNEKQKLNSELNINEMQEGNTILNSNPRRITLELTNRCDLRCIMCGRSFEGFNNPSNLSMDVFGKLEPFLQTAEEITLFGWGEPLVHPNFTMMMEILKKYPNLRRYILTNGTTLDILKNIIEEYRLDLLGISVDGATAKMHNRIRRGSSFDLIIKNIKETNKLRENGISIPYINFVFTLMERNIRELPMLIDLAYELEIPEIKCIYLTVFKKGLEKESLWNHQTLCREMFEIARDNAQNHDINLRLPPIIGEDTSKNEIHKTCSFPWRDMFIGSNGLLRPCMHTTKTIAHYNEANDIRVLWNHEKLQEFRARVNTIDMSMNCKNCYQSSFANYNKKYSHIQIDKDYIYKFNEND